MKTILFLASLFFTKNHLTDEDVLKLYNLIESDSIKIQTSKENVKNYNDFVDDYYKKYFLDGNNIFKLVGDNSQEKLNCGILSLKQKCIDEVFKKNVIRPDKNSLCINVYGVNENLKSSIIQNTVLFIKHNNHWKIVGSRVSYTNINMMMYGMLNGDDAKVSFTNRCYDSKKIIDWIKDYKSNEISFR